MSSLTRSRRGPLRRSMMTASDSVSPHIGWGGVRWLSSRIWSSHRFGGRPGRRFHERSGGRPRDKSTWQLRAWCPGTLLGVLAMWPKMALRRLTMWPITGGDRSGLWLVTCSNSWWEADALKIHILTPVVQPLLENINRRSLHNWRRQTVLCTDNSLRDWYPLPTWSLGVWSVDRAGACWSK